ncbi:30S ribosomal protein S16 [Novosphingobium sp.]|uniref:30S ribosomal protein S16 n=1 Tax=Novosphingobium sp. TaxID=1874826 RepID=UPI00286DEA74|nr:30S ribosomal protein S16 [Novosphingobium sp.]
MSVSLRLSRGGSKKRPYYKIVVANSRAPRDGKYLEQIGTYNPLLAKDDENRVRLVEDRVRYWLGVGGQPTDRVARMLDKAGIKERAATVNPSKGEPGKKAKDRAEDKAAKLVEAEEAKKAAEAEAAEAAAAAAAAPAVEEAAAEEAPAAEEANEATPNSDAGDEADAASGESAQAPAEG